jgi:predicted nucleotidyltransferase component of viral defense system
MSDVSVEELDVPAWVAKAEPKDRNFREAVHIILTAISASPELGSTMVMKGGMLMAIRYNSSRFTKDADFSTRHKYLEGNEAKLLEELNAQIDYANESLGYDTMCRTQRYELKPKRADASFPTLTLSIGYARRSKLTERTKLLNGQAPTIVAIDYSYNEAVFDVEVLSLGDGEHIRAYSFLNLLAEKYRSLLQQPVRKRNREQDVYDINLLLSGSRDLQAQEKGMLLELLVNSSKERNIDAKSDSMANVEVRSMAEKGYAELAAAVQGPLPDFNAAYETVQKFYEELPWAQRAKPNA